MTILKSYFRKLYKWSIDFGTINRMPKTIVRLLNNYLFLNVFFSNIFNFRFEFSNFDGNDDLFKLSDNQLSTNWKTFMKYFSLVTQATKYKDK